MPFPNPQQIRNPSPSPAPSPPAGPASTSTRALIELDDTVAAELAAVIERDRKIAEVASELGIGSAETLRNWVKQARRDAGLEVGPTTEELAEIKRLRKEVADQQRTIEILKAATTFFAQEADPRPR